MQLIPSLHYETYNSYIVTIDRNPVINTKIAGGVRKKSVFWSFLYGQWLPIGRFTDFLNNIYWCILTKWSGHFGVRVFSFEPMGDKSVHRSVPCFAWVSAAGSNVVKTPRVAKQLDSCL